MQEYGRSNPELLAGLRARGAEVTPVRVYQWDLPEDAAPLARGGAAPGGRASSTWRCSPPPIQWRIWRESRGSKASRTPRSRVLRRCQVGSIGPTTSEALEEFGVRPVFEPSHPKMGILVREAAERAVGAKCDRLRRFEWKRI